MEWKWEWSRWNGRELVRKICSRTRLVESPIIVPFAIVMVKCRESRVFGDNLSTLCDDRTSRNNATNGQKRPVREVWDRVGVDRNSTVVFNEKNSCCPLRSLKVAANGAVR